MRRRMGTFPWLADVQMPLGDAWFMNSVSSCLTSGYLWYTCSIRCRLTWTVATTATGGIRVKRVLVFLVIATLILGALAVSAKVAPGPAPNAGDGVSDGSGLHPLPAGQGEAQGPAPNSGDGISDGSGF